MWSHTPCLGPCRVMGWPQERHRHPSRPKMRRLVLAQCGGMALPGEPVAQLAGAWSGQGWVWGQPGLGQARGAATGTGAIPGQVDRFGGAHRLILGPVGLI